MPPDPMADEISYGPSRVPGARLKWLIIEAEQQSGKDSSCLTPQYLTERHHLAEDENSSTNLG